MYKMMHKTATSKWIDLLPEAVDAHDSQNNETVGAPPEKVSGNERQQEGVREKR